MLLEIDFIGLLYTTLNCLLTPSNEITHKTTATAALMLSFIGWACVSTRLNLTLYYVTKRNTRSSTKNLDREFDGYSAQQYITYGVHDEYHMIYVPHVVT